ncbi:hypothetical protein HMPREF1448_01303 [Helicobacter pylori HP260AFi]|uniref:Uncharacterized protein n=1 Tax=Helicobacter pylori HP260AFii TaxID=1159077 RepID=A0ABC9SBW2_HELPX|nr:hypothetical protein HMPREF1399_00778 [Helicobacter pylori GAM118Bi]EMH17888.1 hypothetical protein HMPREF1416_01244 [Helicobacter pylori GAM260ASi]EMH26937.1 hypothetical protein HMPREF1422_01623 [Helicobacter pylori GAM268Bii]EMH62087.1 hypothetical protein HMPREF1448_01303 [Helicobacter pylori HP260AFi]EMH66091.1 hypothetical protein HMPREF1450_01159 [Helicobacter pylori HP260ASii]EMH69022.1 hypothetical protein HMPREF1449_00070 [Helicobacter pylori HP260AFii]
MLCAYSFSFVALLFCLAWAFSHLLQYFISLKVCDFCSRQIN